MLENIQKKIAQGSSLDRDEALWLLTEAELLQLGRLGDGVRRRKHPENRVTFVVDRNVNYSNVCESKCKFCAFYCDADSDQAYLLDYETIFAKVQELVDHGGTQLLMQGGLHPELEIEWFEELFRQLSQRFPQVQIHSLSAAEVVHIARLSNLSVADCLRRLQAAGLKSLPGAGAEVLVDAVRQRISPNKIGWQQWGEVMELAHGLGMRTTATMMFGSCEEPEDIVEHLLRIREIQARTGGFTAFIPWTFQPRNTELGGETATGVDYLKVLALSRIVLDNIDNIQASWVTQGARMAQVALFFGANDLGGTMLEENVVAAAGVTFRMSKEEIIDLARGAGFIPVRRTTEYEILEEY
ncbi:dehypoxanthine futalosine cyclase [Geothermobacter hydrogeniphilus]|uniref:Cyclic dehypoxanthine futalosine synthase n=1 Tax=Geothermobacter hydrogeniphilus TaxID=1969733 RepID=A0A2K2HBN9_9BACT|nr:cyclic dehypoxanthinyl futalosine synthase [Geothermobacter hydrogeniphilus]PNU20660.1 dehypoxanthine futalosine cyclase [Geothermobacter hydrogeniphilus]